MILFEKFLFTQLIIIIGDRIQVGFDPSIDLRELREIIDLRERRRKIFLLDVMHLDRAKLSQSSATDNSKCMVCHILFLCTNQFCHHLLLLFQIRTQSTSVSTRMCVYVETCRKTLLFVNSLLKDGPIKRVPGGYLDPGTAWTRTP